MQVGTQPGQQCRWERSVSQHHNDPCFSALSQAPVFLLDLPYFQSWVTWLITTGCPLQRWWTKVRLFHNSTHSKENWNVFFCNWCTTFVAMQGLVWRSSHIQTLCPSFPSLRSGPSFSSLCSWPSVWTHSSQALVRSSLDVHSVGQKQ